MENQNKNRGIVLIAVGLLAVAAGVVYFVFGRSGKFISPIPAEPSFKVIYYTPTPGPVTPTSTPSATPKVKKQITPTTVPTKAVSATPSVTPKTSPTKSL